MGAPPPPADDPVRWGVIGATSTVARLAVLPALAASPTAHLVAVASRSRPTGPIDGVGDARVLPGYQEVLDDPAVEAVYVPLPNSLHAEWVGRAAAAGRHVLCEKPLAPSREHAEAMARACRSARVVLMEAYMTPFHPRSAALAELASSGRLGPVRFARGAFTGVLSRADDHRWRPEMGGGALLDVGIYCLAPVLAAAGRMPRAVAGTARVTPGGVDASFSGWLDLGGGAAAAIECSFETPERQLLEVVGSEAAAVVERAFTPGPDDTGIELRHRDGRVETLPTEGGDPYLGMVEHFADAVRGRAPLQRPPAASVELAGLLDDLGAAAGLGPRGG
ncbi:MAG: Gfo/Idh/MocA family protein [Acidimicrobiales bacterium]